MGELAEQVASALRGRGYEVDSRGFDKSTLLTVQRQGERRVVLVYPGRERPVTEGVVEQLAEFREKADADAAEITTLGDVAGAARESARRYDIVLTDAGEYRGGQPSGTGGHPPGGGGHPSPGDQPAQGGGHPPGDGGQPAQSGGRQRAQGGGRGASGGRGGGGGGPAAHGRASGTSTDSSVDVEGIAVVGSAALGGLVFVLGYVLTYLLKSGRISSTQPSGAGPSTEQYVAWLFYEMHNVGHVVTQRLNGRSQSQSFDPSTWGLWEGWLLAVPPLLLLVAGGTVAYVWSDGDPKRGVVYGAALTMGYFPLGGLVAVLSQYQESGGGFGGSDVTAGPKLAEAAVLAGVVYPVVFGIVGGLAVAVLRERSGSSTAGGRQPNAPPQSGRQRRGGGGDGGRHGGSVQGDSRRPNGSRAGEGAQAPRRGESRDGGDRADDRGRRRRG